MSDKPSNKRQRHPRKSAVYDEYYYERMIMEKHFKRSPFPVFTTDLSKAYFKENAFDEPIMVLKPDTLEMKMPVASLTAADVATLCDPNYFVDVLQVFFLLLIHRCPRKQKPKCLLKTGVHTFVPTRISVDHAY